MKLYHALDRFCGNRWFPLLLVPIEVCFLLLYSFTTSPLFLNDGMDSAVFKTMGLAILKGKVPYVDIFDHKGPVLYFINALGQWMIPGRMGIFLLQVIGLCVALLYMFKTARLFVGNALSFIVVLFTLFVFGGIIQEGNQCEEWMMYFFTVAFYYALHYIVNQSDRPHPLKYSILYGLCFGMAFFIRPNDAVAMMGGLMTGITIWLVYRKEYKSALLNALCFGAGFLLVAVPVVCYFAWHNALGDLWYGLVGFNKGYSGGVLKMFTSVIYRVKLSLALVFVTLVVLAYNSGNKRILVLLIPILLYEYVLMGTNGFPHYYIVLLPVFCLYFALLGRLKNRSFALMGLTVFMLGLNVFDIPIAKMARKSVVERVIPLSHGRAYNRIKVFNSETELLFSKVLDSDGDSIWNYNLRWAGGGVSNCSPFSSFWHNGVVQCNLITFAESDLLKEKDDITKKKPTWLLVDAANVETADKIMEDFIPLYYDLVATTDTTICNIQLYRRK